MSLTVEITLTDEQIDAIAEVVLAKLAAADRGDGPEWMDVKAAAEHAGCTEGRIRKALERRQLACSQDGPRHRIFISKTDLDHWMQRNRKETR